LYADFGTPTAKSPERPVVEAPAQPAVTRPGDAASPARLSKEEYERRLVDQAFREAAAAGTIGGMNVTRQKFYHVDEFGVGYLDDKS
jgi:hypothetical protein